MQFEWIIHILIRLPPSLSPLIRRYESAIHHGTEKREMRKSKGEFTLLLSCPRTGQDYAIPWRTRVASRPLIVDALGRLIAKVNIITVDSL